MQPTTRLQVSGHRFLVRRMEHALVRGDPRMFDDPLRAQSISLTGSVVLATVAAVVCAVLALVRPSGEAGDAVIVMVRDTGATYVRLNDVLHPVFNLASARLLAGTAADPKTVSRQAVDNAQRGPLLGIPGAPDDIGPPLAAAESRWTVCDDAAGETLVIAGPIDDGAMASESSVLVTQRDAGAAATYLLYDGRRARVDLRHPAVVRALRLDGRTPQPISAAVLSAIPESPEIVAPRVPNAGSRGPGSLGGLPVGSVLRVSRVGSVNADADDYYVVLSDGVQRIGEVTADLIRYTDYRVGGQIPAVAPNLIGTLPARDTLQVNTFPQRSDVRSARVVCAHWAADPDIPGPPAAVLSGDAVPSLNPEVRLAQADGDGPAVDAVSVPAGRSAYVRSVGLTGGGLSAGPTFLVTGAGVLYGIRDGEAAASLGLTAPAQPAPWSMLSVLPRGPELSRSAASVARDGYLASP